MNNLKFKVYNVHAEEFVHDGSEVAIFNMVSWSRYCYVNGFSDVSHLRFLFFTGLFDKYGREICEGDIVKIDSLFHKNVEEVIFKNGSFGFIPNYESLTDRKSTRLNSSH